MISKNSTKNLKNLPYALLLLSNLRRASLLRLRTTHLRGVLECVDGGCPYTRRKDLTQLKDHSEKLEFH